MKRLLTTLFASASILGGCGNGDGRTGSTVSNIEESDTNVLVSTFLTMPDKRSVSVRLINREQRGLQCEITTKVRLVLGDEVIGELSLFQKAPLAPGANATVVLGVEEIRDQTPGVQYELNAETTVARCRVSIVSLLPTPGPVATPDIRQRHDPFEASSEIDTLLHETLGKGERVPVQLLEEICLASQWACIARDMGVNFERRLTSAMQPSGASSGSSTS